MTKQQERASTVRPQMKTDEQYINPLHNKSGEAGAEKGNLEKDEWRIWKETRNKIEDLETKMTEQFEDGSQGAQSTPPMLQAPAKPTQDEWDRHQLTHTPFAVWCPHCLAARNVRRNHPKQGRKGRIVPDTEIGEGPTKVSFDYMYLHWLPWVGLLHPRPSQ